MPACTANRTAMYLAVVPMELLDSACSMMSPSCIDLYYCSLLGRYDIKVVESKKKSTRKPFDFAALDATQGKTDG